MIFLSLLKPLAVGACCQVPPCEKSMAFLPFIPTLSDARLYI